MNANWRNRPTTIDEVPITIDWVIAIDESGSPDLKYIQKALSNGKDINEGDKQFTVTACAIKTSTFTTAKDLVMQVKNKYWKDALYSYNGVQKRVCFHSKEIRGRRGAFNPEIIDYSSFISDLSKMIENIPMRLYSANINKLKHMEKYAFPMDPYDLCLDFVLERLMWNIKDGETCYIILESRGKKEDNFLLDKIKKLIDDGNNMNPASIFSKIKGVYFNPKWCHSADDKKSYWELEIADLCAFPIHKYFAYNHADPAFEVLKTKICGYPNIWGKVLKSFPTKKRAAKSDSRLLNANPRKISLSFIL